MFSPLTYLARHSFLRRGLYGLLATLMSVSIGLATPAASQASIFDLIFQGIRYVQLGNLSDQDEVNLGTQIDRQLKAQGVRVYNRNSGINAYINDIGQRLAATSDRPNLPYTFQVVDDDSINAFATAGGFVYIQTGLIKAVLPVPWRCGKMTWSTWGCSWPCNCPTVARPSTTPIGGGSKTWAGRATTPTALLPLCKSWRGEPLLSF